MTIRNPVTTGIWHQTTKALGKLWQGVINLPARPEYNDRRSNSFDTPRFPPF
jgi:hypothetical protein